MKKIARRSRGKENSFPLNPISVNELEIPEDFTKTEKGDLFLIFDSGKVQERMLIFTTKENLKKLATSEHWFIDGTFDVVPSIFSQMFSIHCIINTKVIPLVYALLPNKSKKTYITLLNQLLELEANLKPVSVMSDFEKASICAFEETFPGVRIRGCFFHFHQAIYRKIQQLGMKSRYDQDSEFALKLRLLPSLALVPPQDMIKTFEKLLDENIIPEEATELLNYFEDTWIGRLDRKGRKSPMFNIIMWSCYDAAVAGLPKTNNNIEGWHRGFSSLFNCGSHPTIWKFISILKKEQSRNEMLLEKLISGENQPPQKKRYKNQIDMMNNVIKTYKNINDISYLRGIAHNFNF